ncbi:hypothetical protein [Nakamurella sp. PAMC28650]|uniref:hypothetical protein n=1 Tax=Nakamurella sp. PAMC28650 TaxID=2762325 RepID=UPI00164DED70|nr:hypothetical protein H7F38_07615 [Nakamurella sp. PAMC28650]
MKTAGRTEHPKVTEKTLRSDSQRPAVPWVTGSADPKAILWDSCRSDETSTFTQLHTWNLGPIDRQSGDDRKINGRDITRPVLDGRGSVGDLRQAALRTERPKDKHLEAAVSRDNTLHQFETADSIRCGDSESSNGSVLIVRTRWRNHPLNDDIVSLLQLSHTPQQDAYHLVVQLRRLAIRAYQRLPDAELSAMSPLAIQPNREVLVLLEPDGRYDGLQVASYNISELAREADEVMKASLVAKDLKHQRGPSSDAVLSQVRV